MLRIAILLLCLVLLTSTKYVYGVSADVKGGSLQLSIRMTERQRAETSEVLLLEVVPPSPFAKDPLKWESPDDINENGGKVVARVPVDTGRNLATIKLETEDGATYWLTMHMKDGTLLDTSRIDDSALDKMNRQRHLRKVATPWIVVVTAGLLLTSYLLRRKRGSRKSQP
jgi:hypothetical protein